MSRFAGFNDDELRLLWDGLTMDEGIRYGVSDFGDAAENELIREIYREAETRGLPARDSYSWGNVV